MKSKTSLFNSTIFLNTLRRYWLGFTAYLGILGLSLLTILVNALQQDAQYPSNLAYHASLVQLMQSADEALLIISFVVAPFAATLLFSHLFNARHTGMMASLPVKRETMYLSVSAAAMAGFLLCNLIVVGLALVIELIYGQVHLGALGLILLISTGALIAFFGMSVFCCMLTGNILAGPAVFFVLNFVPLGLEVAVQNLLRPVVFGFRYTDARLAFLSPIIQMGSSVQFDTKFVYDAMGNAVDYTWSMDGLGVLAAYALVGVLFFALGLLLYRNRAMETAGDTISIEILKPIFRFCMTVCGGIFGTAFISEIFNQITPTGSMAAVYEAVLMILCGTVGYFAAQMLISKSTNVFRKGWKVVGLYALAVALVMGAVELDLFGYEKHIPDAKDVESVQIFDHTGDTNDLQFDEPENIETILLLHQNIIASKSFHEIEPGSPDAVDLDYLTAEPAAEFQKRHLTIRYQLKNGDELTRAYYLSYGPDEIRNPASEIRVLEALLNTPEGISERYIVDYPVTAENTSGCWINYTDRNTYETYDYSDFSPSEIAELYNDCILPDIADGNLGVLDIIEDRDFALSKYRCTINLELFRSNAGYGGGYKEWRNLYVYPTVNSSRTMAFLAKHGIEPAVVYDSMMYKGFDFNDLGYYPIDDKTEPDPSVQERTTEAATGIIGGADGPTSIVVSG